MFFTDKEDVVKSLSKPESILSIRAIDRKHQYGIKIDERDVPVTENYIQIIKSQPGIVYRAKSKWFNCVHLTGTREAISALQELPFVSHISFADRNLNLSAREVFSDEVGVVGRDKNTLVDFPYGNTQGQIALIKTNQLHSIGFKGEGMLVAVLDAGFPNVNTLDAFQYLRDHGRLVGGYNFVKRDADFANVSLNSHGTRVLSTMAANLPGTYVGSAPDAAYVLYVTEDVDSESPVEESYWVEAVERADSLGVNIINTSLGYTTFDQSRFNYLQTEMDGTSTFISRGANVATEKGLLVVNSAGNSGNSSWGIITAPADANVFTVGAVDMYGNYASFSSRGPTTDGRIKPDVMAQGIQTAVINQNGVIVGNNGTSFASPIIAGSMACLWQAMPEKTNLELMEIVRASASLYSNPSVEMGYGIPDFLEAYYGELDEGSLFLEEVGWFPNPTSDLVTIQTSVGNRILGCKVYNLTGALILSNDVVAKEVELDLTHHPKGIYFVEVYLNQKTITLKIIKD